MARGGRELSLTPERSQDEGGELDDEQEEEDDDADLGSADLTLHILAKAEQRGRGGGKLGMKEATSGGGGPERVLVEFGESRNEEAGGAANASPSRMLMEAAIMESDAARLEEGELGIGAGGSGGGGDEAPEASRTGRKKKKKRKSEKNRMKREASAVVVDIEDGKAEPENGTEVKSPDVGESLAMRKLLRGPRYFDPPEEQGEMCYNCGQTGHRAAGCTEQPRQRPCYVCGNFGHEGYECPQRTECYECGKSGHLAKLCPNKRSRFQSGASMCLMCGRLGHDSSACFGDYDPQDFKQVRCYMCKQSGHLCCIEVVDLSPTPVSCYQCGDLGHTGVGCTKLDVDRGNKNGCYKCGQEGHFARDCNMMNQRRHSWPAPWTDNDQLHGRYGDQDPATTPACQYRPSQFTRHSEHTSSTRNKRIVHLDIEEESGRGSKRQRRHHTQQVEDDRWIPKSAGSFRKRYHD